MQRRCTALAFHLLRWEELPRRRTIPPILSIWLLDGGRVANLEYQPRSSYEDNWSFRGQTEAFRARRTRQHRRADRHHAARQTCRHDRPRPAPKEFGRGLGRYRRHSKTRRSFQVRHHQRIDRRGSALSRFVLDTSVSLAWFLDRPVSRLAVQVWHSLQQGSRAVVPRSGFSRWRTDLPPRSAEAPSRGLTLIGV